MTSYGVMSDNDGVHTLVFPINFFCLSPRLPTPDISYFFNLWGIVTMEHTREPDIMHGQEQKFKSDEVGN